MLNLSFFHCTLISSAPAFWFLTGMLWHVSQFMFLSFAPLQLFYKVRNKINIIPVSINLVHVV